MADAGAGVEAVHIAPRREFNAFAPVRPNALYCYGVDFLSTKEVLALLAVYSPESVEWIDDSSCIVVFASEEARTVAQQRLASGAHREEPWALTRPLKMAAGKKAQKAPPRQVQLEIRPATEADRKDAGHSGHTDSVYYAHVKEEQALQRQRVEERRVKKRQRMNRFMEVSDAPDGAEAAGAPAAALAGADAGAAALPAASAPAQGGPAAPGSGAAQAIAAPGPPAKLGRRGLLDPLLFMRAPPGAAPGGGQLSPASGSTSTPFGEAPCSGTGGDLRTLLQKSEAEYAIFSPQPAQAGDAAASQPGSKPPGSTPQRAPASGQQAAGDAPRRGREVAMRKRQATGRSSTPSGRKPTAPAGAEARGRTPRGGRERTPPRGREPAPPLRGKKRRPVSQEPRPVSAAKPAPRLVKALPAVEAFLAESRLRCQRFALKKTYRGIVYGRSSRKPRLPPTGADAEARSMAAEKAKQDKGLPPWDEYLRANTHFASTGHFLHALALQAGDRRVLAVVPHPDHVSLAHVAKAVQQPESAVRLRRLADIEKETGFPVFVCPPVGHPKDRLGRAPLLLVDSTITELKRPLLFDCGSVGLSVRASDFIVATQAVCIEGLAKPAPTQPQPLARQPQAQPCAVNDSADKLRAAADDDAGSDVVSTCATTIQPGAGATSTTTTTDMELEALMRADLEAEEERARAAQTEEEPGAAPLGLGSDGAGMS